MENNAFGITVSNLWKDKIFKGSKLDESKAGEQERFYF